MTTFPLHLTELARNAALSVDEQNRNLTKYAQRGGSSPVNYRRLPDHYPALLNIATTLLGPAGDVEMDRLKRQLQQECSTKGFRASWRVVTGVRELARRLGMSGYELRYQSVDLQIAGQLCRFATDYVVSVNGRPLSVWIEPRRSGALGGSGRHVWFSGMHLQMRAPRPQVLGGLGLAIIQFDSGEAVLHEYDGQAPLYSFDDLDRMFNQTLGLWNQIRGSLPMVSGGSGPFNLNSPPGP